MKKLLTALAGMAIGITCFILPASADTYTSTAINAYDGTVGQIQDYSGAVYINLTDHSGIKAISVHYSWDNYIHVEALPAVNDVHILESYTCRNLGPCKDFISQTGTGDDPGYTGQPHVSIHHNVRLTFHPLGYGHTVVDEHYEHGIITWLHVWMKDGNAYEVYMTPTNDPNPTGTENPDGLPHILEFYFTMGAAINSANYGTDGS